MAVAAVTVGVLVLGGDDDGASPSSTTAGATPTDPFFEVLSPPSDVAIVALGDGSFEVSYVVPEGVASVEIEYANGEDAGRDRQQQRVARRGRVRRPDAVRDAPLDRAGRAGVDRLRPGLLGLTRVAGRQVTRNTLPPQMATLGFLDASDCGPIPSLTFPRVSE